MTATPRITSLHRYPVKACAAEPLAVATVGPAGVLGDRTLAVVADDRVVTQREHPALARVRPHLDDESGILLLAHPGRDPVQAAVHTGRLARDVTLFGSAVRVVDQDPRMSAWLSDVLGATVRLVAAPATTRRSTSGEVPGQTVLSDEGCVSVHSVASLAILNQALAARGRPPVGAERFRANIVIDGVAGHAEDDLALLDAGDARLGFAGRQERCAVTTVDQQAGERSGPEPLRTLAAYRRLDGGAVVFGIHAAVLRAGTLRVGDPVRLTARSQDHRVGPRS